MARRANSTVSGLAEQRFIVYGACATSLPKPFSAMMRRSSATSVGSRARALPPRGFLVKNANVFAPISSAVRPMAA